MENDELNKKILSDTLGFYKYKLDNGQYTMEEVRTVYKMVCENTPIDGTIGDFAAYFGQSTDAVKSVINRRMIPKPKRNVVLYPFHEFVKLVPEKWRKRN